MATASAPATHRSPSNYYLHSDATGRFTMLASGLDQTFRRRVAFGGDGDGLLITRCLGDSSCLEAFRSNLGEVSAAADRLDLEARLDTLVAVVATWRPLPDLERADDPA